MALTNQVPAGVDYTATYANQHSIPIVSATTDITLPLLGKMCFNTTDNMLYRYDGSAWQAVAATGGGTAATTHEARYEQTTFQTLTTATNTKIAFNTAVTTSNDVTPSGTGNTDFLLNRGGLWAISASLRFVTGTTGERTLFLSTGTVVGTLANIIVGDSDGAVGGAAGTLNVSTLIRVSAATSIFATGYQTNGGNLATEVAFGHLVHIAFAWLRP